MHTYRKTDSGVYTVGFCSPSTGEVLEWHDWHPLKDFEREYDAAAFACFLNGGADATPMGAARHTELRRVPAEEDRA
jgi:hypothetical protein